MASSALNRLDPDPAETPILPSMPGDLPERLRRRYLSEDRGAALAYFRDSTGTTEAFRDQGRRLSATRNDPAVIGDLVAIAAHRGWRAVQVRGTTEFRREAWRAARLAGLEVSGYNPTPRDLQDLERRVQRSRRSDRSTSPSAQQRLGVVEAVVRNRIVEPAEQARILAAARQRLAAWLERRSTPAQSERRPRGPRER